jgi:hypothetical protein
MHTPYNQFERIRGALHNARRNAGQMSRVLRARIASQKDRQPLCLCIGDSHTAVFELVATKLLLPSTHLAVVAVDGATARGLANPNSTTNSLSIFKTALRLVPNDTYVIIMLGEVDSGFLVWYHADHSGHSIEQELQRSLDSYRDFVTHLSYQYQHLILVEAPLPTVHDYRTWHGLHNARKTVTATIAERTDLTRSFNSAVRDLAKQIGAKVLVLEHELLDARTGLIRDSFLNYDTLDHHLAPGPFADLVARRMHDLGFT